MNIYWYCPPSVIECFKNPLDNPSFRLRCWHIHNILLKKGINSNIVGHHSLINNPDVVVLMSFGDQEYIIAKTVSDWGASIVHDYSENIRGIPILEETKKLCKFIVCCSEWLKNEESKEYYDKAVCIKDPYEPSPIKHNFYFKDKIRAIWAGMGGNAELINHVFRPIVESVGIEYIEMSNREGADLPWDKYWQYNMASCDIALCPQDEFIFPAKSNVKVTTAMSLGIPVLASPLQSYNEIIIDGHNGFICKTYEDWIKNLMALKNNFQLGEKISENAFFSIKEKYSIEYISNQWLKLFERCLT